MQLFCNFAYRQYYNPPPKGDFARVLDLILYILQRPFELVSRRLVQGIQSHTGQLKTNDPAFSFLLSFEPSTVKVSIQSYGGAKIVVAPIAFCILGTHWRHRLAHRLTHIRIERVGMLTQSSPCTYLWHLHFFEGT